MLRAVRALTTAIVLLVIAAAPATAGWRARIDRTIGNKHMGVAVRLDGTTLYAHEQRTKRIPASNQKILLSMALLVELGGGFRFTTRAMAGAVDGRVVPGPLYVVGSGDPSVTGGGAFGRALPFTPTGIGSLARRVKNAGIRRIRGRIIGSTSYFTHDWFAPGWESDFPARYVALPSALTFEGNTFQGVHISDPERRLAKSLKKKLESLGVRVRGNAVAGPSAPGLATVASVESAPLNVLLRYTNRHSSNFFAEVLGKRLGVEHAGRPGTIAKGAAAIRAWATGRKVAIESHDSSGLSYANRVAPGGLVRLLDYAEELSWGRPLRRSLATGGQGTLEDRLRDVRLRAKTGTLEKVSALSGWLWLRRRGDWASFSILSRGLTKSKAVETENRIARVLEDRAR